MSALRSLILAATGYVFFAGSAIACEACVTRSSMEQTVRQADVIALVVNEDRTSISANYRARPQTLELKILTLYKGEVDTSALLVRSWYGMCAYGVQMKLNSKAMLFLQEVRDITTGEFDGTYKLVEDGCSEGQLEVRDNNIRFNEEWHTLRSFTSTYISIW